MDENFEIELQEEKTDDTVSVQLPLNFLIFGEIEHDDVKVYIKQDVYNALEQLSASDTSKELGSIMIGDYCQEHGKINVIISNYIEAKYTDASASTLTFTHETWDYIHSEHECLYPDKKIIGWQHTHPSYGIFLSNYDMFIQENFFNLPFQIAYVIDPIQNLRGFFQWKKGRVEKLHGFYIYDDVGKKIKIESSRDKRQEITDKGTTGKSLISIKILTVIFSVLILLAFGTMFMLQNRILKQEQEQEVLKHTIEYQQEMINQQATQIEILSQNSIPKEDESEEIESEENGNTLEFVYYKVKQGDSLSSICREHGVEYVSMYKCILAINGIEDADTLYVDQEILLPIKN